jgi:hypothetical protein
VPHPHTQYALYTLRGTNLAEALCCALKVSVDGSHVGGQHAAVGAADVDAL